MPFKMNWCYNKTMRLTVYIISFLTLNLIFNICWAIGPKQVSNNDLRGFSQTFVIEHIGKENLSYSLLKDNQNGHRIEKRSSNLNGKLNNKIVTRRISTQVATLFDDEFVSLFFNAKYQLPNYAGSDCKSVYKLSMRGDKQIICSQEKNKVKNLDNFLTKIKKELFK